MKILEGQPISDLESNQIFCVREFCHDLEESESLSEEDEDHLSVMCDGRGVRKTSKDSDDQIIDYYWRSIFYLRANG